MEMNHLKTACGCPYARGIKETQTKDGRPKQTKEQRPNTNKKQTTRKLNKQTKEKKK